MQTAICMELRVKYTYILLYVWMHVFQLALRSHGQPSPSTAPVEQTHGEVTSTDVISNAADQLAGVDAAATHLLSPGGVPYVLPAQSPGCPWVGPAPWAPHSTSCPRHQLSAPFELLPTHPLQGSSDRMGRQMAATAAHPTPCTQHWGSRTTGMAQCSWRSAEEARHMQPTMHKHTLFLAKQSPPEVAYV